MLVEIAVQDPAGVAIAAEAGADRVELCTGLSTGGLTPSAGLIRAVVAIGLPVRVLIRCREGDFCYQDSEIELMADDIRMARDLGAAGVVVGAVDAAGALDRSALDRFAAAAEGLPTVLHRASDLVGSQATVAGLRDTGIGEVLTSGGAATVGAGLTGLARLAAVLGGQRIVAGGGLSVADLPALAELGVGAVHASASRPVTAGGTGPGAAAGRTVTDPERVATLVEAVRAVTGDEQLAGLRHRRYQGGLAARGRRRPGAGPRRGADPGLTGGDHRGAARRDRRAQRIR